MSSLPTVFGVKLGERRQVARAGDVGLFETRFTIFRIEGKSHRAAKRAHITYQPLLPPLTESGYVSIQEAANRTGHYPCTLTGLEIDGHGSIRDNRVGQNHCPEVEPCPSQLYAFPVGCPIPTRPRRSA